MEAKQGHDQPEKLSELNKKIGEVKKKIQLSEGQRKALFEDCETERKLNSDQIVRLKKEVSRLVVALHESTSVTAKYRIRNKALVEIVGPLADKTGDEVVEMLDLQVIDCSKKLDLLRYKVKQRKNYLADLGVKYRKLISEQEKKELIQKVEKPVKRSTRELQNAIHAIEVQIREAVHIKNRYHDIRQSLKEDSNKFDSNIKKLDEDLAAQREDIEKLQKIMDEATRMRSIARGNLLKEERAANDAAVLREREAAEGKRLVNQRKIELEILERRMFQAGKIPPRPEPEGAEDNATDEDKPAAPPHPVEALAQAFEVLKKVTGGTSTQEVLERFRAQVQTQERLTALKNKSEGEKLKLERKLDALTLKLDTFKYAEVKESERQMGDMERLHSQIEEQRERSRVSREKKEKKGEELKSVLGGLQGLYLCLNPLAVPENDAIVTLNLIETEVRAVLEKIGGDQFDDVEEKGITTEDNEDKWLPAPYSGLIRRTPLPQTGMSPAPPPQASEDEEDVPSRGYLKRQAQMVVDAKTRRKKIQLPKRS